MLSAMKEKLSGFKVHEKRNLIMIECVLGVLFVGIIGLLVYGRFAVKELNPGGEGKYSRASISAEIDSGALSMYTIILMGDYTATDTKSEGEYNFSFGADNNFMGFSEAEEDDFGKYLLNAEGETYFLTLFCDDTTDDYRIEFNDDNTISLINDMHEFTLVEKV